MKDLADVSILRGLPLAPLNAPPCQGHANEKETTTPRPTPRLVPRPYSFVTGAGGRAGYRCRNRKELFAIKVYGGHRGDERGDWS
jgi:hypothetical protein